MAHPHGFMRYIMFFRLSIAFIHRSNSSHRLFLFHEILWLAHLYYFGEALLHVRLHLCIRPFGFHHFLLMFLLQHSRLFLIRIKSSKELVSVIPPVLSLFLWLDWFFNTFSSLDSAFLWHMSTSLSKKHRQHM